MLQHKNLKAILFDSGRVLNDPRTGNWFVPPNFHRYIDKNKFELLDEKLIQMAFYKAMKFLEAKSVILTEEEEFEHFIEFYRILSNELPDLELKENHIIEVARDTVFNDEKFLFYEDVFEVIPQLSKSYKLGVVSDTWPSLERVFKNVGLKEYFSTFVMSSKIGVVKPDELMFTTALSELNIKPEEAIFIDDNINNINGAIALGISSFLLCRDWRLYVYNNLFNKNYCIIRNLIDVKNLLV